MKAGNATPELLQAEIERITQRESRSLELDAEKVQLVVHKQFSDFVTEPLNNTSLTEADMTAARLIIYQSLDYYGKQKVNGVLFPETEKTDDDSLQSLYEMFTNMTEQQFSYLIRMAISNKSESKYPFQQAGFFLYRWWLSRQVFPCRPSKMNKNKKEKKEMKNCRDGLQNCKEKLKR